ncbi:MAG: deoxyribodipyrimidine photolyase, partial [Planctomycetota bacterium]
MSIDSQVPDLRLRLGHDEERAVEDGADYVLYWMTAFRRPRWNFALERAIDWCRSLDKPLVVFEALRVDYRWASDRLHTFVVNGMRDNRDAFAGSDAVAYFPYLEQKKGAGSGLLAALASRAAVVVGDDFPSFFLPAQARAAARAIPCRYELVDSNGLYPMRDTDKVFSRAYDFRRHLQKNLLPHLSETPKPAPLQGVQLPAATGLLDGIQQKWNAVSDDDLDDPTELIASLPIDHDVPPVPDEPGGYVAAGERLERFLEKRLSNYDERNQPEAEAASELSAHLHFGHISAHEVFDALVQRESWTPNKTADKA